jgi:hypothetical protein
MIFIKIEVLHVPMFLEEDCLSNTLNVVDTYTDACVHFESL